MLVIVVTFPPSLVPEVFSVRFRISALLLLLIYQLIDYINEVPIIQLILKPTWKRCDMFLAF